MEAKGSDGASLEPVVPMTGVFFGVVGGRSLPFLVPSGAVPDGAKAIIELVVQQAINLEN